MVSVDPQADIEQLIALLDRGDIAAARVLAEQLRQDLAATALLTTTQAAHLLGIRSRNTLKALVKAEGISTMLNGNRMMIPVGEVMRLRGSRMVKSVLASDQLHEASAMLGSDEGLSQEDLEALEAARPGRPPWEAF